MRQHITNTLRRLLTGVALSACLTLPASAADFLIKPGNGVTLTSNANEEGIGNLIDGNVGTVWGTDNSAQKALHFIKVKFDNPRSLHEGGKELDLVAYIQRNRDQRNNQPTTLKVEISDDDVNWKTVGFLYFLYRGKGTKEYSSRLHFNHGEDGVDKNTTFNYLRFTVTANNSKGIVPESEVGARYMNMAEFNLMLVGRNEDYAENLIDRFRLQTDYLTNYKDATFTNTRGIINPLNAPNYTDPYNTSHWPDTTNVEVWKNGQWELNEQEKKTLEGTGITMPDFSFITHTEGEDLPLEQGQKRQRTHVTEHVLYAVPGDAIALYPYYGMRSTNNFYENFSHWYDYSTGGRLTMHNDIVNKEFDVLDFIDDPSGIQKTEYGFFGGKALPYEYGEEHIVEIGNAQDLIDFSTTVNTVNNYLSARLTADIDMTDVNFTPIGTTSRPFCGIFDGGGHTIKNLRISLPEQDGVGLIGCVSGNAKIYNLIIDGESHIEGRNYVGVVGMYSGTNDLKGTLEITNVLCEASIKGVKNAAGILGCNYGSSSTVKIVRCGMSGSVNGDNESALICGWVGSDAEIKESYSLTTADNLEGNETVSDKNKLVTNKFFRGSVKKDGFANCYIHESHKYVTIKNEETGEEHQEEVNVAGLTYFSTPDVLIASLKIHNDQFQLKDGKVLPPKTEVFKGNGDRSYGSVATFFYPRNVHSNDGLQHGFKKLDADGNVIEDEYLFPNEKQEFVIAADFSQSFDPERNIKRDADGNPIEIIEPTIQFRHIFRIRDGVEFAEEFSGSKDANESYIRKNMRHVTARAGVDFQLRFDSPVPRDADKNTEPVRSKYYYKISNTDYRRVCGMDIRVTDLSDPNKAPVIYPSTNTGSDTQPFYYGEEFNGQGSRQLDGVRYNIGGGGGKYYRFLKCNGSVAQAGKRYKVELIGKDYSGNKIKIFKSETTADATGEDEDNYLVVQQYIITFVGDKVASVVLDDNLPKADDNNHYFSHTMEENLEKRFGAPKDKVDFDEYSVLDDLERSDYFVHNPTDASYEYVSDISTDLDDYAGVPLKIVNWPVAWDQSKYSFGYDKRYDYNMYMLANHAAATPYHAAAIKSYTKEYNGTHFAGLYDRLHYDTRAKYPNETGKHEDGYFYYVNAATDPGVMARLKIDNFCEGSVIHVSAWVAEFSEAEEVGNIAFNFVAVMKDGTRIPVHSFVSGYINNHNNPGSGNTPGAIATDRESLGRWMQIYYSFVPPVSEMDIDPRYVDRYELELDNNCKNSGGADYAIDNIRMYLTTPTVFARQLTPICDLENPDSDIKIHMPFEVLLQSIGEEEVTGAASTDNDAIDNKNIVKVYYTFVDKKKYESEYARLTGDNNTTGIAEDATKKAYEHAVLRYSYGRTGSDKSFHYGVLEFSKNYNENDEYSETLAKTEICRDMIDDERQLVFITRPDNPDAENKLVVGRDILVALYLPRKGDAPVGESGPGAGDFKIYDDCAKVGTFRVQGSTVIKIDGVPVAPNTAYEVCENQRPVVQVDLYGTEDNGSMSENPIEENAWFDWFSGTYDDFDKEYTFTYKSGEEDVEATVNLMDAHAAFRAIAEYKNLDNLDNVEPQQNADSGQDSDNSTQDSDNSTQEGTNSFSQAQLELLKKMVSPDGMTVQYGEESKKEKTLRMILHSSSYVFPAVKYNGEPEVNASVLALPISMEITDGGKNYLVCTAPTQIDIVVRRRAPQMWHGLDGIGYPASVIDDVPLRIGFDQLNSVSATTGNLGNHGKKLDIPVRDVAFTTAAGSGSTVTGLRPGADTGVYLARTTDPNYQDLNPLPDTPPVNPDDVEMYYKPVGMLRGLRAEVNGTTQTDYLSVVFDEEFEFREGYEYSFRFGYEEISDAPAKAPEDGGTEQGGTTEGGTEQGGTTEGGTATVGPIDPTMAGVCPGQHVFTLKVVPEYQKWTGEGGSLNWNNDKNWSRVTKTELNIEKTGELSNTLRSQDTDENGIYKNKENNSGEDNSGENNSGWAERRRDLADYVSDVAAEGKTEVKNANIRSYAPLDFTKVIINAGVTYPHLYGMDSTPITVWDYSDNNASTPYNWSGTIADVNAGEATENIQYDMAARYTNNGDVGCRPWYAHTCRDIHFRPHAEIMNQQHLTYQRAWVEMELDPSRWYTLSSPMQETVAGDMYLPSANAREESRLFLPIEFDEEKHNRFKPAVFQRGWDKATAHVYELDKNYEGENTDELRNVAVETAWSNVYNDVKEVYSGGVGFSIKSDVSRIFLDAAADAGAEEQEPHKVLFRLPKHDRSFDYYNDFENAEDKKTGHNTEITRKGHYKLNGFDSEGKVTITARSVKGNKYFLVGNPFMAHMKMKEFLEENTEVIERKFWIVDGNGSYTSAVLNENGIFDGSVDGADLIAPMQGFFVQAKDDVAVGSINLVYKTTMMETVPYYDPEDPSYDPANPAPKNEHLLRVAGRDREGDMRDLPLTVTAVVEDEEFSKAVVSVREDASKGYDSSEDAALLTDPSSTVPVVYTAAEGVATLVNTLPSAEGVEIGVTGGFTASVKLRFDNVSAVGDMFLFDVADGSLTPLEEGMEVEVEGNTAGRLFLVSGVDDPVKEADTLLVKVEGRKVTVESAIDADAAIHVSVFDVAGRVVNKGADFGRVVLEMDAAGIYIIHCESEGRAVTRKVNMR